MTPIMNWGQQATLDFFVRYRRAWGISPTMQIVADQMEREKIPVGTVMSRVERLVEDGWLTQVVEGARAERNYLPSVEARLIERLPEVVMALERASSEDARASELLNYARGMRVSSAVHSTRDELSPEPV